MVALHLEPRPPVSTVLAHRVGFEPRKDRSERWNISELLEGAE